MDALKCVLIHAKHQIYRNKLCIHVHAISRIYGEDDDYDCGYFIVRYHIVLYVSPDDFLIFRFHWKFRCVSKFSPQYGLRATIFFFSPTTIITTTISGHTSCLKSKACSIKFSIEMIKFKLHEFELSLVVFVVYVGGVLAAANTSNGNHLCKRMSVWVCVCVRTSATFHLILH